MQSFTVICLGLHHLELTKISSPPPFFLPLCLCQLTPPWSSLVPLNGLLYSHSAMSLYINWKHRRSLYGRFVFLLCILPRLFQSVFCQSTSTFPIQHGDILKWIQYQSTDTQTGENRSLFHVWPCPLGMSDNEMGLNRQYRKKMCVGCVKSSPKKKRISGDKGKTEEKQFEVSQVS